MTLFFIINYYNRPSHDDFWGFYMIREQGVVEGTIFQYTHWCTRFIGVFISLLVTSIPTSLRYFFFNTFLFLLFVFSIYRFIKNIASYFSPIEILNISLFTLSGIFYSSINIGETWFWLSANCSYTLSFVLFILGLSLIATKEKKYPELIFMVVLFLLIGGLNEILSGMIICSGFAILVFFRKLRLNRWQILKILLGMTSVSITLLIVILGPGNALREAFFREISFTQSLLLNLKMTGIILFYKIAPKILIFVFWAVVLSVLIPMKNKLNYEKKSIGFIVKPVLIFLAAFYLFQLPITYKTQDIAAIRVLLPVSVAFLWLWYALFSTTSAFSKYILYILMGCLAFQISCLAYQSHIVRRYAESFDNRMAYIEANKNKSDTLKVAPLPNSGWIHSAEISDNPKDYTNQQLKKGLNLNCEIIRGERCNNSQH